MGRAHAGNTKMLYRQQEQQTKDGKQPSPRPHPRNKILKGLQEKKEQFSTGVRHPSKG